MREKGMREEGRKIKCEGVGGSELGSDLDLDPDPDPWKTLSNRIRIRQNDADSLDPYRQHCGDKDLSPCRHWSSLWHCHWYCWNCGIC